jgi:hypothetical protein
MIRICMPLDRSWCRCGILEGIENGVLEEDDVEECISALTLVGPLLPRLNFCHAPL